MPVMENERKRTEEVKPKNNEKPELIQEHRKPESVLNVIAPVYRKHIAGIDRMNAGIAAAEDSISRKQNRITELKEKIERLENTNEMLKAVGGRIPGMAAVIAANEKRIENIRNIKIPAAETKIENHKTKISKFTRKRELCQCKADKLQALSGIIKSFAITDPAEKRTVFAESMDKLNESCRKVLSYKLEKCESDLRSLGEKYLAASTSTGRYDIQKEIDRLKNKQEILSERIERISQKTVPFRDMNNISLDISIVNAEKTVAENADKPVSEIAEKVSSINISEKTTERKTEDSEKINPEYYWSLDKADRVINVEPGKVLAGKIMDELSKRNVPFSAVIRKDDTTAITVSGKDAGYYEAAKSSAKNECVNGYEQKEKTKEKNKATEGQAYFSRKGLKKESADIAGKKSEPSVNRNREHAL